MKTKQLITFSIFAALALAFVPSAQAQLLPPAPHMERLQDLFAGVCGQQPEMQPDNAGPIADAATEQTLEDMEQSGSASSGDVMKDFINHLKANSEARLYGDLAAGRAQLEWAYRPGLFSRSFYSDEREFLLGGYVRGFVSIDIGGLTAGNTSGQPGAQGIDFGVGAGVSCQTPGPGNSMFDIRLEFDESGEHSTLIGLNWSF